MLSPWIVIVNIMVKLATMYVNNVKCSKYVIILTGHGDFGDKDIVHQAKVPCVVCREEFIVKTRGTCIFEWQCFILGVKEVVFQK